ncbi:MAG TPA: TolC family protein [Bryobacteraceae bacterium]|nr:TolC family protein [Bryobacteraceae bacterium]
MRRFPVVLLLVAVVNLQAQPPAAVLQSVQDSKVQPRTEQANTPIRTSFWDFLAPYRTPSAPELRLGPAERARTLVRNASIYLSLYDAIALAIENNLDVEVSRYNLSVSGTDVLRASGGGSLRGVDYNVTESPTGVGGPGSPLLNSAASSVTPTTPTVNDLTSLNILSGTPTSLSQQGAAAYSAGPAIPVFQPTLTGTSTYFQRANTPILVTTTSPVAGSSQAVHFTAANYALVQGFSYGTQVEVNVNNAAQVAYTPQSQYNPFSVPNTSITVSQPLLRGFGRELNLRYLRIAAINQKITRLVFYQQLISTVYGVARLYYDLVSLNESAAVKRQSLQAARKLAEDDAAQVEQGTLAPLELTRANALVTSSQLDLIQSEGLVHQQEVILKSQLARQGSADPILLNLPIVPTDVIAIPAVDDLKPIDALVADALATRPDLAQAALQVQSGQISAKASRNGVLPEINLIANFQTRGSSEIPYTQLGTPGTGAITAPADLAIASLRTSHIYQAGIQLNLPLKNSVAQADAARDLLQLRQVEARTQSLANQVRQQVENAVIALQTARSALEAATQTRQYQEQLVQAERDKLTVGASTNFLVIQQESYLAQARSTEVAARSVWIKARVALDRALGNLLDKNGITFDQSVTGELPATVGPKP